MARPASGMTSAVVAGLPYLVLQLDRGVRRVLRGFGGVPLVIVLLLSVAVVPPIVEGSQQQPLGQSVDDLRDGVSALAGWVRMRGRIVTLSSPQTVEAGRQVQSLLVEPSGDAVVLLSRGPLDHLTEITGRISNSANMEQTSRSVGGPRFPSGDVSVVDRYVISVDDPIALAEQRSWTLVWAALAAAAVLLVGRWVGYPVVRLRRDHAADEVAAAQPLAVGEEVRVRVVEPEDEIGPRLRAPWGRLRRLDRRDPADPYFELRVEGKRSPVLFRRHRWSSATPGTLWTLSERVPVVHLHDWGIEVALALEADRDRDRLLASFVIDEEEAGQTAVRERVGA